MLKGKDLADKLMIKGFITEGQFNKVIAESKRTKLPVEELLVKMSFVTSEDIANLQAGDVGVPFMDLTDYLIDPATIKLVPEQLARKYKLVPLFKIADTLTVGMVNPQDIIAQDEVRRESGCEAIEPVMTTESAISRAIDQYYGVTGTVDEVVRELGKTDIRKLSAEGRPEDLTKIAEEAPVVKLVNLIVMQALKDRSSDIHIEPDEEGLRVRYRIDGLLHEINTLPCDLQSAVVSRIKVLSKMDIAEKRRPQDGRIQLKMENKDLDLRVSTFPTVHGENVVMRILDKSSVLLGLAELGLAEGDLKKYDSLIRRPFGIILVTGPTGSGKTTTLYSSLNAINTIEKNIITIEDPVEYHLSLIRQSQVNPKAGLTFANGLRSILRQDPNVIMVGEIRDGETAEIAVQAALTGHLVFSTLHTNDAAGALTRLVEMGIEPFLVASSVIGVVAQRLVRVICHKCKKEYAASEETIKDLKLPRGTHLYEGKGCKTCKDTGYLGRIAIFELLIMNDEIKKLVIARASSGEIKKAAIAADMRTLKEDGIEKVKAGVTSLEEILRATEED